MTQTLSAHRKMASDLSLGASDQKIYQQAIELIKDLSPHQNHLDFGSGQGSFLELLDEQKKFSKLTGIDLMGRPQSVGGRVDWIQGDLNESLQIKDSEYDSISALEIIEHLENPRHVFRELYRILKPGGWLLMSTPNNESFRSLVSLWARGHFVAFTDRDYPAHITPMNRLDLKRAALEAGFEFKKFDFVKNGRLPGFTSMSWQGISFGMLKGVRFSDNFFAILRKP